MRLHDKFRSLKKGLKTETTKLKFTPEAEAAFLELPIFKAIEKISKEMEAQDVRLPVGESLNLLTANMVKGGLLVEGKFHRALRPDAQAFDEIRIRTVPRLKESELSGDEWRISSLVEFIRKGKVMATKSYSNVEYATRFLPADFITVAENGAAYYAGEGNLCDQEGCCEPATKAYKLKAQYCRDGHMKENFSWVNYRLFCERHSFRGDCSFEDSDKNYEVVPISEVMDTDRMDTEVVEAKKKKNEPESELHEYKGISIEVYQTDDGKFAFEFPGFMQGGPSSYAHPQSTAKAALQLAKEAIRSYKEADESMGAQGDEIVEAKKKAPAKNANMGEGIIGVDSGRFALGQSGPGSEMRRFIDLCNPISQLSEAKKRALPKKKVAPIATVAEPKNLQKWIGELKREQGFLAGEIEGEMEMQGQDIDDDAVNEQGLLMAIDNLSRRDKEFSKYQHSVKLISNPLNARNPKASLPWGLEASLGQGSGPQDPNSLLIGRSGEHDRRTQNEPTSSRSEYAVLCGTGSRSDLRTSLSPGAEHRVPIHILRR